MLVSTRCRQVTPISAAGVTCSLKRLRRHQAAGPLPTPPARRSSQFVIMVTTAAFWLGEARQMTTEAQCEPTSASSPSVSRSAFAFGYKKRWVQFGVTHCKQV